MNILVELPLLLLLGSLLAVDARSKLQVQIPKALQRKDGYDHMEASFGFAPYGGTLQQKVYYAGGTLCDSNNIDPTAGYPSRPDKTPWEPPFILMVDVHACGAASQVTNAQNWGASAVLLADTRCMCFRECVQNGQGCHIEEPDMTDIDIASGVTVPAFYMYKEDADAIKERVMKDEQVIVSMSFNVPAPDDRVEYDLWMEPLPKHPVSMLPSFGPAAVALGEHARFTPHMLIYDGVRAGCADTDRCQNMCTNNGRYCQNDPDGNNTAGNSGAEVVEESLRRICIWRHYGMEDGIGREWWDYTKYFMRLCENANGLFADPKCRSQAMKSASVDEKTIAQCMQDSGGLEGDVENTLLTASIVEQVRSGVATAPTFFVNNAPVRGHLDFTLAFRAICSGFPWGSEPEICDTCAACNAAEECVASGGRICSAGFSNVVLDYQTNRVSGWVFMATLFMFVIFAGGLAAIYMRYHQVRVRREVRGLMSEYVKLDTNDDSSQCLI
uniref:Vacuolar sorting receptor thioredoxin-like domain-containing protein n=1 Tax=Amphora coffeiformis TaxID=265554 RepID=A0A7S3P662_9STRA|mmetsp:Transcript_14716/g.27944  ORF Transcript_14716/g.27944 Transcript_14716/m.27944 type:complete len:499 (+) Transcript_14716:51-1547(+)